MEFSWDSRPILQVEYLPNLIQIEANSRERAPPTGQTQRAGERAVRTRLITLVLAKKRDAKIIHQSSNKGTDLKLTGEPYSKRLILRAVEAIPPGTIPPFILRSRVDSQTLSDGPSEPFI